MTPMEEACAHAGIDPQRIASLFWRWDEVCKAVPPESIHGRARGETDNLLFLLRLEEFERRVLDRKGATS